MFSLISLFFAIRLWFIAQGIEFFVVVLVFKASIQTMLPPAGTERGAVEMNFGISVLKQLTSIRICSKVTNNWNVLELVRH